MWVTNASNVANSSLNDQLYNLKFHTLWVDCSQLFQQAYQNDRDLAVMCQLINWPTAKKRNAYDQVI